VSPHWSCVLVSMCVRVLVWLGWGGIRVAGFQEHMTNVVTQLKSHRLLMMNVLMSKTCWA